MKEHYVNLFTDFGFKKIFGEEASKPHFSTEEESSLKYYRDLKNVIDTARDEGREEGFEAGQQKRAIDIARNLLPIMDDAAIAKITGLTSETIQTLRQSNNFEGEG